MPKNSTLQLPIVLAASKIATIPSERKKNCGKYLKIKFKMVDFFVNYRIC